MLLRNYDNAEIALKTRYSRDQMAGSSKITTDTTIFGDGHINVKDTTGTLRDIYSTSVPTLQGFLSSVGNDELPSSGYSNLVIGSSDKEVTYDDYCMGELFTSSQLTNINNGSFTEYKVYDSVTQTYRTTYVRSYLANEDIIIKEIGVISGLNRASNQAFRCLVYREVLETPIEVLTDSVIKLTFTITQSANPNKPTDYVATASVE